LSGPRYVKIINNAEFYGQPNAKNRLLLERYRSEKITLAVYNAEVDKHSWRQFHDVTTQGCGTPGCFDSDLVYTFDVLDVNTGGQMILPNSSKLITHQTTVGIELNDGHTVLDCNWGGTCGQIFVDEYAILESEIFTVTSRGEVNGIGLGYWYNKGPGYSTTKMKVGNAHHSNVGGSHGGRAAGQTDALGYGSYMTPITMGSGGSTHSSWPGGCGGSAVRFKVTNMHVDGTVTTDGQRGHKSTSSSQSSGGSGAGGSILLEIAETLTGTGFIRSIGGASRYGSHENHGSAGGGGRIALICQSNDFTGSWLTHGGRGYDGYRSVTDGGAGTVYIDCDNQVKHLILDNNNYENPFNSLITNFEQTYFELNVLEVRGRAIVAFRPEGIALSAPVVVDVEEQRGDKTGILNVIDNTKFMSKGNVGNIVSNTYDTVVLRDGETDAYETNTRRRYFGVSLQAQMNVFVYPASEFIVPHSLYLDGVHLNVQGRLSGTRNVVLSNNSQMTLYNTGYTDNYTATRFPVAAVVNATSAAYDVSVFNCSTHSPATIVHPYMYGAPPATHRVYPQYDGLTVEPIETTPINPFRDYPSGEVIEADKRETQMGDIILDFGYVGNRSLQFWNAETFCVYTSNDGENWERQSIQPVVYEPGDSNGAKVETLVNFYHARYVGMGGDNMWGTFNRLSQGKKIKVLTGAAQIDTWEPKQGHYTFESIRVEEGGDLVVNSGVSLTSLNATIGGGNDGATSTMRVKGNVQLHTTEFRVTQHGHVNGDGQSVERRGVSKANTNYGGAHAGEGGGYADKEEAWRVPGARGGYGDYEWPRTGGARGATQPTATRRWSTVVISLNKWTPRHTIGTHWLNLGHMRVVEVPCM
jgi:hypothetical protein